MLNEPRSISIPRHELYEQVWSQPMTLLARQYGISDVALAKICRKLSVPYPGRGYWRKKQTGKVAKQLPLPPSADPAKQLATIFKRRLAQPSDHASTQSKEKVQQELTKEQKIEVPDRLVSPHKLLSGRLTQLRSPKVDKYGAVWSGGLRDLNLRVSPMSLQRALRIMNALFHALESRRYQLSLEGGAKSSCVSASTENRFTSVLRKGFDERRILTSTTTAYRHGKESATRMCRQEDSCLRLSNGEHKDSRKCGLTEKLPRWKPV